MDDALFWKLDAEVFALRRAFVEFVASFPEQAESLERSMRELGEGHAMPAPSADPGYDAALRRNAEAIVRLSADLAAQIGLQAELRRVREGGPPKPG